MGTEKRSRLRFRSSARLQVHYVDAFGNARYEIARVTEVSENGCRIMLAAQPSLRAVVRLQALPAINASATVRHRIPSAKGFATGVEFLGGFRLNPASLQ